MADALVIGARGMLGRDIAAALDASHRVLAWDIDEIDITERSRTVDQIAAARPEVVVNAAAFVDLEGCETDPDRAWLVNAVGAGNVALGAEAAEASLVYISTDYVFDGRAESGYDEVSHPNPLNQYGRSKLAGEQISRASCRRSCAVRTAWLFGHATGNYVARVLDAADRDGVVRMPDDQVESPTYTGDLAAAIVQLVACRASGIVHMTSRGACTRAEFAAEVLGQAGRTEPVEVVESRSAGT
ncbi:MAG: dTDP-4-dehydrorhamnose reductase, partial [Spirochaetaceae bacterium]|nr:dTDP-4-dehydrorhamnose reductase [Spirochaetaceae bacterium]